MKLFYNEKVANSDKDTYGLGFSLGKTLKGGDVVLLSGELGSGKTTFAKGIGKGLGIDANINSPTFQIIREYPAKGLTLYHIDMYRINEQEAILLGIDELSSRDSILIIEWNKLEFFKKNEHYDVGFEYKSENSRKIRITLFGGHYKNDLKN